MPNYKHQVTMSAAPRNSSSSSRPLPRPHRPPPAPRRLRPPPPKRRPPATAVLKAPMIGTFYRSSGPESPAFVQVGDMVEKGQVICIIEAMKLFNEIEAEQSAAS